MRHDGRAHGLVPAPRIPHRTPTRGATPLSQYGIKRPQHQTVNQRGIGTIARPRAAIQHAHCPTCPPPKPFLRFTTGEFGQTIEVCDRCGYSFMYGRRGPPQAAMADVDPVPLKRWTCVRCRERFTTGLRTQQASYCGASCRQAAKRERDSEHQARRTARRRVVAFQPHREDEAG